MNETCNGYTNWATFITDLYFDNEKRLYDAKIKLFTSRYFKHRNLRQSDVKNMISRFLWTIKQNETGFYLKDVNVKELTQVWNKEKDEYNAYNKED